MLLPPPRHDHPAHRAERQAGAGKQPARLRHGKRRDHAHGESVALLGDPKVRAAYAGRIATGCIFQLKSNFWGSALEQSMQPCAPSRSGKHHEDSQAACVIHRPLLPPAVQAERNESGSAGHPAFDSTRKLAFRAGDSLWRQNGVLAVPGSQLSRFRGCFERRRIGKALDKLACRPGKTPLCQKCSALSRRYVLKRPTGESRPDGRALPDAGRQDEIWRAGTTNPPGCWRSVPSSFRSDAVGKRPNIRGAGVRAVTPNPVLATFSARTRAVQLRFERALFRHDGQCGIRLERQVTPTVEGAQGCAASSARAFSGCLRSVGNRPNPDAGKGEGVGEGEKLLPNGPCAMKSQQRHRSSPASPLSIDTVAG